MKYEAKKRMVSFTGIGSLGWHLGRGYVQTKMAVKAEKWCVVDGSNKSVAVCQSKQIADKIAALLNESQPC